MILSTTPTIEGRPISRYCGVVMAQSVIGANVVKDFMASLTDFFGGRSRQYENVLREGKDNALRELSDQAAQLGASAVVGIKIDIETVGASGSMFMVVASGTAVCL